MKPLNEYEGEYVKVLTIDGKEWHGYAFMYSDAYENDEGEESMAFRMKGFTKGLVELHPSEIQSIEIEGR